MVVLTQNNIQGVAAYNERAEFATQSGLFVRSLLLSTLCRDAKDAPFHAQLAGLFDLSECRQEDDCCEVERFIRQTFAAAYGADVRGFMPRLLAIRSKQNEVLAAFGVRSAEKGKLFLENYLDQPVEQVIAEKSGALPQRNRIAEIGNLAAIYPGAVRWMIVALTVMLYEEGYDWVAFTGTAALRNGFNNLGLHPAEIRPACVERLAPDERARWGTYYDNKPIVMIGNIREGFRAMRSNEQLIDILSGEKASFFRVLRSGLEAAAGTGLAQ
jgi:Thermostable hemolysin